MRPLKANSQCSRILAALVAGKGTWVPAPTLHRAGSGKENGYVGSLTKRIDELRRRGHNILPANVWHAPDGSVHSEYQLMD